MELFRSVLSFFRWSTGSDCMPQSRSKYDLYKQLLHLSFEKALIRYAQNEDYRGQMVATGELLKDSVKKWVELLSCAGWC